ncbi:hypothetical protein T439DRAFT_133784 [Meredithblackwellia eburnea MCA 4105]
MRSTASRSDKSKLHHPYSKLSAFRPSFPNNQDAALSNDVTRVKNLFIAWMRTRGDKEQDALVGEWGSVAERLVEGEKQGWLSEQTRNDGRGLAQSIMGIRDSLSVWKFRCNQLIDQGKHTSRRILQEAGPSASADVTPSTSSSRTRSSSRPTPPLVSSVASALDDLHAHRPLRQFFLTHISFPYPTASEKTSLLRQLPSMSHSRQISNWFVNSRRRSGWNELWEKYAQKDRDRMDALVRDLRNGEGHSDIVDAQCLAIWERVNAYFGEKEGIGAEVMKILEGFGGTEEILGGKNGGGVRGACAGGTGAEGTPFAPSDNFFAPCTPSKPRKHSTVDMYRTPSSSSSASNHSSPSFDSTPPPPQSRSVSNGSTNSGSSISSLLSYMNTPSPPTFSEVPDQSLTSSPPPPPMCPLSTSSAIPIPPPTTTPEGPALDSFTLPVNPSPYYSTMAEHPYGFFGEPLSSSTGMWGFEGALGLNLFGPTTAAAGGVEDPVSSLMMPGLGDVFTA